MVLAGAEAEVSVHHDKLQSVLSLKLAAARALGVKLRGDPAPGEVSEAESDDDMPPLEGVGHALPKADDLTALQAAAANANAAFAAVGGACPGDLRLRETNLSWKVTRLD